MSEQLIELLLVKIELMSKMLLHFVTTKLHALMGISSVVSKMLESSI